MIDPKSFISAENKEEDTHDDMPSLGGTFICQDLACLEAAHSAKLDEIRMRIIYVCPNGHKNEARL